MVETHETRLLRVEEVARRLNVSRANVYRRIHDGSLPAPRIGTKALRVAEDEMVRWLYRAEGSRAVGTFAPFRADELAQAPGRPRRPRGAAPTRGAVPVERTYSEETPFPTFFADALTRSNVFEP